MRYDIWIQHRSKVERLPDVDQVESDGVPDQWYGNPAIRLDGSHTQFFTLRANGRYVRGSVTVVYEFLVPHGETPQPMPIRAKV